MKNYTKVFAKNVKEEVVEREDVVVKSTLKKRTYLKKLPKKVVNSDIAKMAISQGLAYAPRLYDMGTSRIGNEKVKKLLQSEMGKNLLKKGLDKAHSKL